MFNLWKKINLVIAVEFELAKFIFLEFNTFYFSQRFCITTMHLNGLILKIYFQLLFNLI